MSLDPNVQYSIAPQEVKGRIPDRRGGKYPERLLESTKKDVMREETGLAVPDRELLL